MSIDSLTPYADINAVLYDFQQQIAVILGEYMVGMYVYGSLALGDFDPATSDIDFVVVTDGGISVDTFVALDRMHAQFT
ncbi:MAG TPA: nucleotidyltransferase domain-containing protein, partial [Phototrophicaceae bacterium]|nr:nucleotidyltransferase domain-containing protein [Phototrophicaceae bacterium]